MLFNSLVTIASASVASAAALFPRAMTVKSVYPPQRAAIDESSHRGPCGGTAAGEQIEYPLSGGKISVTSTGNIDNLNFLYGAQTSDDDYKFQTYGEKTVVDMSAGHYCGAAPDFGALGYKAGDDATILIMYQADGPPRKGTDKRWQHICADIKLVDTAAFAQPQGLMCANAANELRIANQDEVMNYTVSPDSGRAKGGNAAVSTSTDKFTDAEAGGIGAGITAGVFLLMAGALWAMGRLSFGKKKRVALDRDDTSSVGSVTKQVSRN